MNLSPIIIIVIVVAILVLVPIAYFVGYHVAEKREKRSRQIFEAKSKAVNKGLIAEHLAPLLPDFPPDLKPSEMRFIGKPVDFLVFKGMDEQKITELVFVEVKTGTSGLNNNEKQVKEVINHKKVSWREYRPNLQLVSEARPVTAEPARRAAKPQATTPAQDAAAKLEESREAKELHSWELIKNRNSVQDVRNHLARFPGGTTERYARAKLGELSQTSQVRGAEDRDTVAAGQTAAAEYQSSS